MPIINRALDKAYKRRTDAQTAKALEQAPPVVGGWASKLREPNRRAAASARTVAAAQTVAAAPDGLLAPSTTAPRRRPTGPVVAPAGVTVRVDTPHASAAGPLLVDDRPAAAPPTESRPVETVDTSREQFPGLWAWPPVVERLLNCPAGAEINRLAGRLKLLAAERGLGCVAFSGSGREAGRTSLVLTLAKALTQTSSARVVVVDADFEHPDMARMISVRPRSGLWDVACEHRSGTSPLTTLIPGKLALVPLVARVAPEAINRKQVAALQTFFRSLRRGYDLVLVDAGPWELLIPSLVFENRVIDAFICVARHNDADEQLDDAAYHQPGIEWLGMIETFTPASQLEPHTV